MTEDVLYTVIVETVHRPRWDAPSEYHLVRSGLTGPEADDLEAKLNSEEPTRLYSVEFDDDVWPEENVIVVTDQEARDGDYRRAS